MKKLLLVLTPIALVLAVSVFLYWFFLIRGPLAGETRHNFGEVHITGERAVVEHVFHLTNRTGHALAIKDIRADCGCTTVSRKALTLQPGESFDLATALSLNVTGSKTSSIFIDMGEDGRQMLVLKANGRRDMPSG